MGVMEPLVVPYDGWTVDDLPDDDLFRHSELVDGALLVNPPPSLRHQEVAAALMVLLRHRRGIASSPGTCTWPWRS